MYKLTVSTAQGYTIATFHAGNTMKEANAFYKCFMQSGLYANYYIHIKEEV